MKKVKNPRVIFIMLLNITVFCTITYVSYGKPLTGNMDISTQQKNDIWDYLLSTSNPVSVNDDGVPNAIHFEDGWLFGGMKSGSDITWSIEDDLEKGYANYEFDDSQWMQFSPHISLTDMRSSQRNVILKKIKENNDRWFTGWYRLKFDLPESWKGSRLILAFQGVARHANIYLNGQYVGNHEGTFTPFEFDATSAAKFGEDNILAVHFEVDFLGLGSYSKMPWPENTHSFDTSKNHWVGIYQPVFAICRPNVNASRMLVNTRLDPKRIEVDCIINNCMDKKQSFELRADVYSWPDRSKVASKSLGSVSFNPGENEYAINYLLPQAELWSPENPNLYWLELVLIDDAGKVTERADVRFGMRVMEIRNKHFYLNGKRVFFFGDALMYHNCLVNQANFSYFMAPTDREKYRLRFAASKAFGNNLTRPHCNPSGMLMAVADEVGMMIYNEWGWAFGHPDVQYEVKDPPFGENCRREMKEWLYATYNYPSGVLYSLGNEMAYTDIMAENYRFLRPLDKQGRPMACSSGGEWDSNSCKNTDFYDIHWYAGCRGRVWKDIESYTQNKVEDMTKLGGPKPVLMFEMIDWSYSPHFYAEGPKHWVNTGSPDEYLEYARNIDPYRRLVFAPVGDSKTNWFLGTSYITNLDAKRQVEILRRHNLIDGFCIWQRPSEQIALWLNHPVCIIADLTDGKQNIFAGGKLNFTAFVKNDSDAPLPGVSISLVVSHDTDPTYNRAYVAAKEVYLGDIAANGEKTYKFDESVADHFGTSTCRATLTLYSQGTVVHRNEYNMYLLGKEAYTPIKQPPKKVFVLGKNGRLKNKVSEVLHQLGIKHDSGNILPDINQLDILIIAPNSELNVYIDSLGNDWREYEINENKPTWGQVYPELARKSDNIKTWLNCGGVILVLEQSLVGTLPFSDELDLVDISQVKRGVAFADRVLPGHPVFNKIGTLQLDTWSGHMGVISQYGVVPVSPLALSVARSYHGTMLYMGLMQGSVGDGAILMSQLAAVERYNVDSAATAYLLNLICYVMQPVSKWEELRRISKKTIEGLNSQNCEMLDISKVANRPLEGKTWLEINKYYDISHLPRGKTEFAGVPFYVIKPDENGGLAAVTLRGSRRKNLPISTGAINVDFKINRLFFAHALAYCRNEGRPAADYLIIYSDGSKVKIPVIPEINAGDWCNPRNVPEAILAWEKPHSSGSATMGIFVLDWKNPYQHKSVKSIELISSGDSSVPLLFAVTAEKIY